MKNKKIEKTDNPADEKIINEVPEIPEEFVALKMILACHPTMFEEQAKMLFKRYSAFTKHGFTEEQALQLCLQFGLNANLSNE